MKDWVIEIIDDDLYEVGRTGKGGQWQHDSFHGDINDAKERRRELIEDEVDEDGEV